MTKEILDYFNGDKLAAKVWQDKYAQEGDKTPDDMHRRMAKEFFKIEEEYQKEEDQLILFSTKEELVGKLSTYGSNRKAFTEESIYELFKDFKHIIPQGRVMAGLGDFSSYKSLSNCLRLPPPRDSYSSIMYVDTMLVSSAKRGCGYGLGLSNLRPKGIPVKNASRTSTGPVSFMPRYSNSTKEVAQDARRGACLEDLDIRHPDAREFANSKLDKEAITGANISLKSHDDFMKAVENDEDYIQFWPCDVNYREECSLFEDRKYIKQLEYDVLETASYFDGFEEKTLYFKKIKAKELFDNIVHNAWKNAEPGLFNWDRVIDYDPASVYKKYEIDGTNACGEQPMAAYDTCRLILLNLFGYIINPFTPNARLDEEKLYQHAYEQMRLGDDLVDLEIFYIDRIINKIESDSLPEEQKVIELTLWENVKDMAQSGRRVGCGITALADALAGLNLTYGSEESLEMTDKIMSIKMRAELDCSIDLAILRGTFEGWDGTLEFDDFTNGAFLGKNAFYDFIAQTFPEKSHRMMEFGRRNVNWSTIAPAGSASIVAKILEHFNTSSGGEPHPFNKMWFMRRKKINPGDTDTRVDFVDKSGDSWQEYPIVMGAFKDWLSLQFSDLNFEGLEEGFLTEAYESSPWYGGSAADLHWKSRINMQSVQQTYTTSAISSTLNLPKDVTEETVALIYMEAWKAGLKGVTVYRDGSRDGVLISGDVNEDFTQHNAPKRPKSLPCKVHQSTNAGEDWLVVVGLLDDKPYEVFITKSSYNIPRGIHEGNLVKVTRGKYNLEVPEIIDIEGFTSEMTDEQVAITRLVSTSLRHGANIKFIVEQLSKTGGDMFSFVASLGRVLKKYIPDGETSTLTCENCGSTEVVFQEGCNTCQSCGSSKCG